MHTTTATLADTPRGARIYLQGKWLLKSGFEPSAAFEVEIAKDRIVLRTTEDGSRRVSAKMNRTVPVIDIRNSSLLEAFEINAKLQVCGREGTITITPAHTAQMVAARRLSMSEGSLFSGGGLMTEAARSLGFVPRFAVEIDPRYAEIYSQNHPTADMFNLSVEDVSWETLRAYAPLGLMTLGIPCQPFANVRSLNRGGQKKRDRSLPPEAHELGDMTYYALRAIEAANPYLVVVEEAIAYLNSGAGFILQHALRRMGYHVDARVISPVDFGELQIRRRALIIGRTDRAVEWPSPAVKGARTLADILEPSELVEGEWFDRTTKPWLFEHWEKQAAKGNGFTAHVVTASSEKVGAITKRYLNGLGDNYVIAHPAREGTFRFFTLKEIMRLNGLREDYYLGDVKTVAGECLGQGAVVTTMARIIACNLGMAAGPATPGGGRVPIAFQSPQGPGGGLVLIEPAAQMSLFPN